ncbi:TIM-barrel domain-containing protein [Paenibacillus ginsengarvi]|uniref:DUF5110 domain-containing protein n=1 Tax=Paenibacillus ginsengarvi TaxID=400777 RepID=A0A3B0BFX8_9BACL|nr:TIM-barrel domain-containing protein [Paenibacillus ginsengarvi]RKN71209.1 DUF5110 domain-containing protein [Paenibacillus ginsengarvi]
MRRKPTCTQFQTAEGSFLRINAIASNIFHITVSETEHFPESPLVRYDIVRFPASRPDFKLEEDDEAYTLRTGRASLRAAKRDGRLSFQHSRGELAIGHAPLPSSPELSDPSGTFFEARFELDAEERIYGTGIGSDTIMKRGQHIRMRMMKRDAYTPVPFLMSSRGWGLYANTSDPHDFDIGHADPDRIMLRVPSPTLDYLLFAGSGYAELLSSYTAIAGKPRLLPLWAYGLAFIGNQQANARETIEDAMKFRDADIPCDMIGLDATWMEVHYDRSTNQNWHPERFFIPRWNPKGQHTFIGTLRAMGFKLSLWLGSDFDLTRYEERLAAERVKLSDGDAASPDTAGQSNGEQEQEEIWYTHLEKFVDQGVSAFKLTENSGALKGKSWSNGMGDEEMHHLYPLLLAKQMHDGFKRQTGKRPMVYAAEGYAGIQQYAAMWAGGLADEPDEPRSLVKILNASLCGLSNMANDMDIHSPEGIHFGFLQPWSKVNSWAYWRHPCLLDVPLREMFKRYAKLRYRLIPYIYSSAYTAYATGMPIIRAMPLMYPRQTEMAEMTTQYMFGDSLLVGAFTEQIELPEGEWIDYWTGRRYRGPAKLEYHAPEQAGGPLFVRAGAILPMWPEMNHVGQKPVDTISLHIYPHKDSEFTLYEDDGVTCKYEEGAFSLTTVLCESSEHRTLVHIGARNGQYDGMSAERSYDVFVHLQTKPSLVTVDGSEYQETTRAKKSQLQAGWSFDRTTGVLHLHVEERKNRSGSVRIELLHGGEAARKSWTTSKRPAAAGGTAAVRQAEAYAAPAADRRDFRAPSPSQFEKHLEMGLETGNKGKLRSALERLMAEETKERTSGEDREQLLYVSGLLAGFIERKQWPMKQVVGDLYERFLSLQTEAGDETSGQVLLQVAERIADYSQTSRTSALHPLVQQLQEMVEQEMDQQFFTLNVAAQRLHVNASHLSRLFKQETGKSFSDYMMEQKMIYAKRLMQNGSKVADAGLAAGFKDTGYFIRVFRNYWGITPGELKL